MRSRGASSAPIWLRVGLHRRARGAGPAHRRAAPAWRSSRSRSTAPPTSSRSTGTRSGFATCEPPVAASSAARDASQAFSAVEVDGAERDRVIAAFHAKTPKQFTADFDQRPKPPTIRPFGSRPPSRGGIPPPPTGMPVQSAIPHHPPGVSATGGPAIGPAGADHARRAPQRTPERGYHAYQHPHWRVGTIRRLWVCGCERLHRGVPNMHGLRRRPHATRTRRGQHRHGHPARGPAHLSAR